MPTIEQLEQIIKLDEKKRIGKTVPGVLIFFGYLFSSVSLIIGLTLGLSLRNSKSYLSDGTKVFMFTESVRKHGRNMLILSSIFSLVDLIITGALLIIGYNNPDVIKNLIMYNR